MGSVSGNHMVLVERCIQIINNSAEGTSWARLNERVPLLNKASKREKTKVFQYLKTKGNLWNNNADDMSDTLFMLAALAPEDVVSETSSTNVSVTATAKKERLMKFSSIGTKKHTTAPTVEEEPPAPEVVEPPVEKPTAEVVQLKPKEPADYSEYRELFKYNSFYNEDEVLAEMAWHVAQSGDVGITLSSLRMSVPEFSESEDEDRAYLINRMRRRYGIQFYHKEISTGRVIKVMALNRDGSHITRPEWFIKQHREVRRGGHSAPVTPLMRTFGEVHNNPLAAQLAQLNAAELFAKQAGTVEDEFDEDEDDSMFEVCGNLPAPREAPEPLNVVPTNTIAEKLNVIVAPKPIDNMVLNKDSGKFETKSDRVEPPTTLQNDSAKPEAGVSKAEVTQAADTLRLIAAQLEAQATVGELLREKKARFDTLMKQARQSSVDIGAALQQHNSLLDALQSAADDLASI